VLERLALRAARLRKERILGLAGGRRTLAELRDE
jgi:hypothetical protein